MLIKFNKQMMQVVNEALVRMPYAQAAPVINEINRQVTEIIESQKRQQENDLTDEKGGIDEPRQ